jgi:hypothetical protein
MATLLYWLRIFEAAALTAMVYAATIIGYALATVIPIAILGWLGLWVVNLHIWKRRK